MNRKFTMITVGIVAALLLFAISINLIFVAASKTDKDAVLLKQIKKTTDSVMSWHLVPASDETIAGLKPLMAVGMADFIELGMPSREPATRYIRGEFDVASPVSIGKGPFTVAFPLLPRDRQGSVEDKAYKLVLYMQVADLTAIDLLRQDCANGGRHRLQFSKDNPLVPFAVTENADLSVVHCWYPIDMTLTFGGIRFVQQLSHVTEAFQRQKAEAPVAIQPPAILPTVVSSATEPPAVKIFAQGEVLPSGVNYTVSQLVGLVGRHFEPLSAYLLGDIQVVQIESRLWMAKPVVTDSSFGFVRTNPTQIEIEIPFDTPAALKGKSFRIKSTREDPMELLNVSQRDSGNIAVRCRLRRQLEINGKLYPDLQ